MKTLDFMVENWFLIVALAAVFCVAVWVVCKFIGLPTQQQKTKIQEWLKYACIEAERELQSDTGQLKLRQVYNAFCAVPAFSATAKLISFETFSEWLKDALVMAKEMLVKNATLAEYVYGNNAAEEVEKLRKQLSDAKL